MWEEISQHISRVENITFVFRSCQPVSGGCISQSYKLLGQIDCVGRSVSYRSYFVKFNQADRMAMFEAEALGLNQLYQTNPSIRVPQPICWGVVGTQCYLVMEWLDLKQVKFADQRELGRSLAKLHRLQKGTEFGWDRDNTIGVTPQINSWTSSWETFWKVHRIGYQIVVGHRQDRKFLKSEAMLNAIPVLLADHHPQPSLLHGDLWRGNVASLEDGTPVIFDPAVYWGDREVDLAMTELFGGFSTTFYDGYNEVWPLDAGYEQRKLLYNLYHIINHLNMFGNFRNDTSLSEKDRLHILNHFNLYEDSQEELVDQIMTRLLRVAGFEASFIS